MKPRPPFAVKTVREQIVEHIRQEVFAGRYENGASLREQALAEQFGVSRGPIRDALLQLTKEGLLVSEPNRGAKVRPPPSEASRPLLVALRRQIETFALQSIFEQITPEQLRAWKANLDHFKAACESGDMGEVVRHDMAFHRSLIEATRDEGLVAIWLPMITHMMLPYSRHRKLIESYQEHRAIFNAIKTRDLAEAIRCLEKNIQ